MNRNRAILGLFFVTGVSGLVYEVVWARLLTQVFGHTIYAVSTVLTAYMAGLALGSWRLGRAADRVSDPLRLYARLELWIGVTAVALPWVFTHLDVVLGPVYRALDTSFALFSLVRFAICFALLLVPTSLMGATLPVLARAVSQDTDGLGRRVGRLYAVNTLGAVLGCFATGFVLLEALGIRATVLAAAGLNLGVAAGAFALSRTTRETEAAPAVLPQPQVAAPPRLLLLVFAGSGFIALALEVVWTRALVFSFFGGSSTYAFATMLTLFLAGLALGAVAGSALADRLARPLRALGWIEVAIGTASALSMPLLLVLARRHLHESPDLVWILATARDFGKSALVMAVPTLLMGAAFPLAARLYVAGSASVAAGVGRLYAANTVGAIFGAFAAGFLLIPALGMGRSLLALGTASAVLGAVLFLGDGGPRPARALAATAAVLVAVAPWIFPRGRFVLQQVGPEDRVVFYREGETATVAVLERKDGNRDLLIDNLSVAGTNPVMMTDQKTLAHLPPLLHPGARKVLTVGFGSGAASWSYTLHPQLETIHCVEIAPTVLEAHRFFPEAKRGGPFPDPRYRVILDDAQSWLLLSGETYDVIATDCTDLRYKSNADLYTVEYFDLCRRRLNEDGLLVVWMPLTGLTEPFLRGVLGTFRHVFPQGSVWYMNNYPTHYLLLVGPKAPLQVDWTRMQERLSVPAVRRDLASIDLADPFKLLSAYLLGPRELAAFTEGAPLNREDRPWVEFGVPRTVHVDIPANLRALVRASTGTEPALTHVPPAEEHAVRSALDRALEARTHALRGHVYAKLGLQEPTRYAYRRALALTPHDESLRRLLGAGSAQQARLEEAGARGDRAARRSLAFVARERGELATAESLLRQVAEEEPGNPEGWLSLGRALEMQGGFAEAGRLYARLAADPALGPEARAAVQRVTEANALQEAFSRQPRAELALRLSAAYLGRGDLAEAAAVLDRALPEVPAAEGDAIRAAQMDLFLAAGMDEYAEDAARAQISLRAEDARARYTLLQVAMRAGRLEEAETEFVRARAAAPDNPSIWLLGARLLAMRERPEEARAALRRAGELGGESVLQAARDDALLAPMAPPERP